MSFGFERFWNLWFEFLFVFAYDSFWRTVELLLLIGLLLHHLHFLGLFLKEEDTKMVDNDVGKQRKACKWQRLEDRIACEIEISTLWMVLLMENTIKLCFYNKAPLYTSWIRPISCCFQLCLIFFYLRSYICNLLTECSFPSFYF